MGLFDKVSKISKDVSNSFSKTAGKIGSNVVVTSQEQEELISLNSQINVINQELDASYIHIGRKYVEYVFASGNMPEIDVSDILKFMEPKIIKKQELEKEIIRIEKEIKQKDLLREKAKVEELFIQEKAKLDKALAMDLLSQEEYDAKIASVKKKVDNFESIRKFEQQAEMGLITEAEKEARIRALTQ